ncbi:MAG: histone-like nucleoid-structuring protein Lsr2 [Pseudonocardia sp.]
MVKHTRTTLVDDLDGSPASGTVRFGLDGRSYEIDLSDENAARLRAILADYAATARSRGRSARPRRAAARTARPARPGDGAAPLDGQDGPSVPDGVVPSPGPTRGPAAEPAPAGPARNGTAPVSVGDACLLLLAGALDGLSARIARRG